MHKKTICILGGGGFVGKTLANQLCRAGYRLRILTRNREQHKEDLILLPDTDLIQANVHNAKHLETCFKGCDAVINLVGILNEAGRDGSGFHHVHVALVEKIIKACRKQGVKRVLHMSALNADAEHAPSHYLRSKGEAEQLLLNASDLNVTCYRPSVIFGKDDDFFNRFAKLLKVVPIVFPLACPNARFEPVYVQDVAQLMVKTLEHPESYGCCHEIVGPEYFNLKECVEFTAHCLDLYRIIIPLNPMLSRLQAAVFDFIPGKPFSTDNYLSCQLDSTSNDNALEAFGIKPTYISTVVPKYLADNDHKTIFDLFRSQQPRTRR